MDSTCTSYIISLPSLKYLLSYKIMILSIYMSLVAYLLCLFLPQIQLLSQPSPALMWPVGNSPFSDHRATEESPAAESFWQYSPSPNPEIRFSGAVVPGLFPSYLESWIQKAGLCKSIQDISQQEIFTPSSLPRGLFSSH